MDSDTFKYFLIKKQFHDDFDEAQRAEKEMVFGLKKRNQRNAPLIKRTRELKEEADREQQLRIMEDIEVGGVLVLQSSSSASEMSKAAPIS